MNDNFFDNTLFSHRCIKTLYDKITTSKIKIPTEFNFIEDDLLFIYFILGDELADIMPQKGMKMHEEFFEIKEKYYSKKQKDADEICAQHDKEIIAVEKHIVKENI